MVSRDELRQVMPHAKTATLAAFHPHLDAAMREFAISTYLREAAFLAQIAHESGELRFMEEIWGPTAAQRRYEPVTTLSRRLGNTQRGDGKRYKGRGPIQLTGRANYQEFGRLLGLPLEDRPELAATPEVGFRVAGLFWKRKGLNAFADARDFRTITKLINGGFNGMEDRQRYYDRALLVLSRDDEAPKVPAPLRVEVDGVDVTAEVRPYLADGRTMVALRPIARRTGLLILEAKDGKALVQEPEGEKCRLPLVIRDGLGFVPLRELPYPLDWDAEASVARLRTA